MKRPHPTARIRQHNITELLAFVDKLEQIDRNNPTHPDGYPTRTPGARNDHTGPAAPCNVRDCEHHRPCPDHDTLTSVEAAADARMTSHRPDPVHTLARRAQRAARRIADNCDELNQLRNDLERLQGQTVDTDHANCRLHAAAGRIADRYRGDLCRQCYDFAAGYGFEPTPAIIDHGDSRGWSKFPATLITEHRPKRKKRRR